ncbi:hypothetical protein B0H13DRAFT_2651550 [Mycena leptocephala]|nr:hypothetical protein B0H13DRAFT_2651550 [Mycena leptocephala]
MNTVVLPYFPPERLVAFINDALHDPANPKSCWNCLTGGISMLFGSHLPPDFIFGKTCTIWPAILKFITYARSDQELANLVASRRHCFCANDWEGAELVRHSGQSMFISWNTMWQTEEPAVASSPFHGFFSRIFNVLSHCIPFGPETTVKSLHQWIHLYRDPEPWAISLLGVVGHVSRSLVVPTIADSPNLAADIAKIGHEICDITSQRMLDQSLTDAQVIEIGDAFHRPLGHLHTPAFFSDEVLDLATFSIQVFTEAAATLYVLGNLLHEIPPTAQHMRSDIIAAVLRLGKESGQAPNASAVLPAYTILKSSKERNVCFSLGCHRSIQMLEPESSPDGRFRRCSGCQLVSYCGQDCQVVAWRDPAIPHRDICASIKTVIKQGGGSIDSLDKWRVRAKKGQIDEDLARNVVDWFTKWETMQASKFISN